MVKSPAMAFLFGCIETLIWLMYGQHLALIIL